MILQLIEKKTPIINAFNILNATEAATTIYSLKKLFTTCGQKTLEFFQWLWLLSMINFIIAQLFAKHRFLKNISAWLLLTSKFFSEFDSIMFCYHNFHMLQKGFSQLFFAWSIKLWVSLKLWNNHSRDWINNFPWIMRSVWWRGSFVFPMMQIKVINNWVKLIIKTFCNFFVFQNQVTIFIENKSVSTLLYLFEKQSFQLPKTVCRQQCYKKWNIQT